MNRELRELTFATANSLEYMGHVYEAQANEAEGTVAVTEIESGKKFKITIEEVKA